MSIPRIYQFLTRALLFAIVVTLIYIIIRYIFYKGFKKEKPELLSIFLVFYLASLIQITVIRGYEAILDFNISYLFLGKWQLVPLYYTFMELKRNLWIFLYHVLGNILWFMPLGFLLPCIYIKLTDLRKILLICFLVSLSIEVAQWFLNTGISDIDDIIFNVAGGIAGFYLFKITGIIKEKRCLKREDNI
ncbi:MAG: VanZ family protein [Fusobacteria bacterium]|nr:VanZ family protein [Fusobacteriota bacterium]